MKTTSHSHDCRAHGVPASLKKKKRPILLLIVSISIPLSSMAQDGGRSVTAIADIDVYAYSYRNWNRANWGIYEKFAAGWNPTGGERRVYLNFDLSELNPGPADKVQLRLY